MINKNMIRTIAFAAATLLLPSLTSYGGQPADDAGGMVVVLEHVQSGKVISAKTDSKGNFSFSDVEAGSYRLRIGCREADGGGANARAKKVECLAEMRIEISDKSKGQVTGTIQKSANN